MKYERAVLQTVGDTGATKITKCKYEMGAL